MLFMPSKTWNVRMEERNMSPIQPPQNINVLALARLTHTNHFLIIPLSSFQGQNQVRVRAQMQGSIYVRA